MVYKFLLVFLGLTAFIPASLSSAAGPPADVTVDARLERVDASHAALVLDARIAPGLHIYAQSQPKPFLASKISISDASTGIVSIDDFTPDRDPIHIEHGSLGVQLHEFEDSVQWRANVQIDPNASVVLIEGSVFAQACQADRCFAPQTYSFSAKLSGAVGGENAASGIAVIESGASSGYEQDDETSGTTVAAVALASLEPAHEIAKHVGPTGIQSVAGEPSTPRAINDFSIDQIQVQSDPNQSAWTVIPLAFVAGFLLNFMPCVLPVVGLKLISFVQQANADRKQILLMNLAYTAGLLSVMMVLASLAVFAGLGWGQQFSSPAFTVTLSAIVFAFGLSFLGVWEIPLPGFVGDANGKVKQEGYAGAFSKGILSTLLATPCSGPFLGAALAWAVTQPGYLTFSVFAAVGIGMASPYLVVGLFPSTIQFLPKPGDWMVTFKQVMGFIMLLTVIYLVSFMPVASVVPTMLLLLGIGTAVWFAARTPLYASVAQQTRAWSIASGMIVLTAVVSFGWLQGIMQARFERAASRLLEQTQQETRLASTQSVPGDSVSGELIPWQTYTPELFESLVQSGKPVFVDFTADWCLTCQANEATAIETQAVAQAVRESGAVALRADKTESNPDVDALLRRLGNSAASIPFYAVFPAGHPEKPLLLDGVFASPKPFVDAISESGSAASFTSVKF